MNKNLIIVALTALCCDLVHADPFMTVEGREVSHVKHCLFHDSIYESHFSPDIECSFDVDNPPPDQTHDPEAPYPHPTNIAHDPECFSEQNIPLN